MGAKQRCSEHLDEELEAGGDVQLRTNRSAGEGVELQLANTLLCPLALGLVRAG